MRYDSMQDMEQKKTNDFVIEKIKERPISRRKLLKRSITTVSSGVIFGLFACFTFLVLEPVISNWLYPKEEPRVVIFPEEQEEMEPQEMLSDKLGAETTPAPEATTSPTDVSALFASDEEKQKVWGMVDSYSLSVKHYEQMYTAIGELAKELNKYLVTVTAIETSTDWLGSVTDSSMDTFGVAVGNNGQELLILTNYSSLKDADALEVTFAEKETVKAQLKQKHTITDIAIVSIDLEELGDRVEMIPIASFGSSSRKSLLCAPVIALGSPTGIEGSVGYGMITSENSEVNTVDANYNILVTDIYGGQNGAGFLFNLKGQIIGVITSRKPSTEVRYLVTAYGISDLKALISLLAQGDSIPYLGITGTDVTKEANEEDAVPMGVYVKVVALNSPAMQAGVQPGDVVVAVGNKIVANFDDYYNALTKLEKNTSVKIKVRRQNQNVYKEIEFDIFLEEAK